MDRSEVARWVAGYERAWRTAGVEPVRELFTEDATYLPSPWAKRVEGLVAIEEFWEDEREGPDEKFDMASEIVAVDGNTAVARVAVDYGNGSRWRDVWIIQFADDGRCRAFEEWPFAPEQPDGH